MSKKEINEYKQKIFRWVSLKTNKTQAEVEELYEMKGPNLDDIFAMFPELMTHQEPENWGKVLGFQLEILEEKALEYPEKQKNMRRLMDLF